MTEKISVLKKTPKTKHLLLRAAPSCPHVRSPCELVGDDESHVLDVRLARLLHGWRERREEEAGECGRAL